MRRAILRPLLLGVAGLLFTACPGPGHDPEDLAKGPADRCKLSLAAGDYEMAKLEAKVVVENASIMASEFPSVDQAVFCYTTANTLSRVNEITKNIESQLSIVAGLLNGSGGLSLSPQGVHALAQLADDYANGRLDPQAAGAVGVFLDSYLGPVASLLEENAELLEFIIQRNQFQFQIDTLPLKIADKQLINAGGRYDLGEIHLLYGVTRGLLGLIYTVQSQDYSITLEIVSYALGATTNNPLLDLGNNPVRALSNAFAVLMTTSPKFLALDSAVGEEKMAAAGDGFANLFDSILKSINVMQKRPEAVQAEHVIEFKTENSKNYFVLHMQFENLVPLVDLRKFDGTAIPLRDDVLASLENIAKDFSGASGVNTNLQRDVFPIVALTAVVLINSGAFQALIDLAVSGADQATKDTINQVLGLVADNPDLVLAALVGAVPVDIELDFGHIFKNPVGLRDVFPAWVYPNISATSKDAAYYQAFTAASVVYSYECADDTDPIVTGELLCANPTDTAHFRALDETPYVFWAAPASTWTDPTIIWKNLPTNNFGTLWEANVPTPADGIQTGFPYIGWKDATFGGLLYLDVTTINQSGKLGDNGIKKANLQTLNATIASIIATVESFF